MVVSAKKKKKGISSFLLLSRFFLLSLARNLDYRAGGEEERWIAVYLCIIQILSLTGDPYAC
jgi:hypothetical protein